MKKQLRIGILAGEASGDILGAGLMAAILEIQPNSIFVGVGGPLMIAQGLDSRVDMERLSVMGYIEPLKRLPDLLKIRKDLRESFLSEPPDLFIGIDYPEFNLSLEVKLRQAGIPCVHYVSPSVWAWREKRIKKIGKAVDLVLCLFPFEVEIYKQNNIPVSFVGHPLADEIPDNYDVEKARAHYNIPPKNKVLALLPGSRQSEVSRLAPVFLQTARLCLQEWPGLTVLLPCVNKKRRKQLEELINHDFKDLPIQLIDGQSREVMAAADYILITSGTATLEALLLKKPMLVCYRLAYVSYAIISRLLKVPYFSLPNLLARKKLVEELLQKQVNPELLFMKISNFFNQQQPNNQLQNLFEEYSKIHKNLRRDASKTAAEEVLKLVDKTIIKH